MIVAFYVLSLAGAFGAFDVFYYHIYRARLWSRPQSVYENITHAIRALLFAVFFVLIVHVEARGTWWLLYPAICAVEMTNSFIDCALEKSSRLDLGGLDAGEYLLHVLLSIMMGAIVTAMLMSTYPAYAEASYIGWRTLDVPPMMIYGSNLGAVMAVGFFFFEGSGVLRMLAKMKKSEPLTASAPAR